MGFTCVECGTPASSIYREFSKGTIRLTKCECCQNFCDKYVEFESVLLLLDMILHKSSVYRHLLCNAPRLQTMPVGAKHLIGVRWKLVPLFIVLQSYLSFSNIMPLSSFSSLVFLAALSILEWIGYVGGVCLAISCFIANTTNTYNEVIDALLLSSFAKAFVVVMLIWNYDLRYLWGLDLFVFTSNVTALKVLLRVSTVQAATCVLFGVGFSLVMRPLSLVLK